MHEEILTEEQKKLLPLVKQYSNDFFLVGGTAIALQIGHRFSIDFDLFTKKDFDNGLIADRFHAISPIEKIQTDQFGQYSFFVNSVQFTFMKYRFPIAHELMYRDIISMPDLLTLGAMKFHALGRRAKWKDYVDLYFIIKDYHSVSEITTHAAKLFPGEVNIIDMRAQLQYFHFMDYRDEVIYMPGFKTTVRTIQEQLTLFARAE